MVWTAFEIAINCVQGLLILMFVKQCFAYEKQHPVADAALVLSCAGLLTFLLSRHILFVDQLFYVFQPSTRSRCPPSTRHPLYTG